MSDTAEPQDPPVSKPTAKPAPSAAEAGDQPKPSQASLSRPADSEPQDDSAPETEFWVGRTHWKHYMGRVLLCVAANVALAILLGWLTPQWEWLTAWRAFLIVGGAVLLTGLVVGGHILLVIVGHRYRLTSERLFIERGILSQSIDQTELIRVDDVRVHKTLLNRLLGLGSVAISSTDATDREILIEGIKDPDAMAEAIRGRMRSMRKKSLFIENL